MVNESVHQEAMTFINVCNCGSVVKYKKQLLTDIKEEIESPLIIVGDFSNPIVILEGTLREKITRE